MRQLSHSGLLDLWVLLPWYAVSLILSCVPDPGPAEHTASQNCPISLEFLNDLQCASLNLTWTLDYSPLLINEKTKSQGGSVTCPR